MQEKAEQSSSVNSEPENHQWIIESAYYKALARNFTPYRAQEDWLDAKKDYEIMLSQRQKNGLVSLR